jgi:LmbE family N-acetylglucosaminyl deacetylase
MTTPTTIAPGEGRTILLVVAHADDPALFLGGAILRWADASHLAGLPDQPSTKAGER